MGWDAHQQEGVQASHDQGEYVGKSDSKEDSLVATALHAVTYEEKHGSSWDEHSYETQSASTWNEGR